MYIRGICRHYLLLIHIYTCRKPAKLKPFYVDSKNSVLQVTKLEFFLKCLKSFKIFIDREKNKNYPFEHLSNIPFVSVHMASNFVGRLVLILVKDHFFIRRSRSETFLEVFQIFLHEFSDFLEFFIT